MAFSTHVVLSLEKDFCSFVQKEVCAWAWELLTDRLGLDKDRLYVTYFGGHPEGGLQPDEETKNIWLNLG
jgi:alanyl-tRNA synthetase